jgi:hypothetical protein
MSDDLEGTQQVAEASQTSVNEQSPPQSEVLTTEKVNSIVKNSKEKAYRKGYEEALKSQNEQSYAQQAAEPATHNQQSQNYGALLSKEDIAKLVQEQITSVAQMQQQEYLQQQNAQRAQSIYQDLQSKFAEAKSKYEDFDSNVNDEFLSEIPQIVLDIADSNMDSSADVLYHLSNNLGKVGALMNLPSALRKREVQKLAKSIVNNEASLSKDLPKNPLKQSSPSNVQRSGGLTMDDYRKKMRF